MQDLTTDWGSPHPARLMALGALAELHPLSELPHPIVAKAAESFPHDDEHDNYVGWIGSSTAVRLMEIKVGQWRGGVWRDEQSGINWLVVAGLAKGGHEDHDDFYNRVKRENDEGDPRSWLPTDVDHRLLKQETSARLLTEWQLLVQRQLLESLKRVQAGGSARIDIAHPILDAVLATITLSVTPVRESDYQADEVSLEILPDRAYLGSDLVWQLRTRLLISLSPPELGWDRFKDAYANIAEPGYFTDRVATLESLVANDQLAVSEPGHNSHYAHRKHLAGSTINGKAVRALCGVYFVPAQNHDEMPCCPSCQSRFDELTT